MSTKIEYSRKQILDWNFIELVTRRFGVFRYVFKPEIGKLIYSLFVTLKHTRKVNQCLIFIQIKFKLKTKIRKVTHEVVTSNSNIPYTIFTRNPTWKCQKNKLLHWILIALQTCCRLSSKLKLKQKQNYSKIYKSSIGAQKRFKVNSVPASSASPQITWFSI